MNIKKKGTPKISQLNQSNHILLSNIFPNEKSIWAIRKLFAYRDDTQRILLSRYGAATPALFRPAHQADAVDVDVGVGVDQIPFPACLITGAARKQPPGCFVLSKAPWDSELFLPFFLNSEKGTAGKSSRAEKPPPQKGSRVHSFECIYSRRNTTNTRW